MLIWTGRKWEPFLHSPETLQNELIACGFTKGTTVEWATGEINKLANLANTDNFMEFYVKL